jgi:hypothetical protein
MDWFKKAPTAVVITVIVVCGFAALSVLGGFVALTIAGEDTTDYRGFINTLANLLMFPFVGVAAIGSVSAARSAARTEEQTNGTLTARDAQIADLHERNAQLREGTTEQ